MDPNHGSLSNKVRLLLVLTKVRTADRFSITPGRVSQIFHEWTDVMAREFCQLIV